MEMSALARRAALRRDASTILSIVLIRLMRVTVISVIPWQIQYVTVPANMSM
jgi:hypothetical protein